eukprot:c15771_g1_i1.p1 GENE.c15771_g1_i1~~c15771_g1_i1.p1  ORF type:complete len:212 (+),score=84.39 c15771_g1_i1:38-637(+)
MSGIDLENYVQVIKAVRDGTNGLEWASFSVDGQNLKVEKTGNSINTIRENVPDNSFCFILIRVFLSEDKGQLNLKNVSEIGRVKFVLITWIGLRMDPKQRGTILETSPFVKEKVGHVHVDIGTSSTDDLTEQYIVEKVKNAAGAFYDNGGDKSQTSNSEGVGQQSIKSEDIQKPKTGGKGGRRLIGNAKGSSKLPDEDD